MNQLVAEKLTFLLIVHIWRYIEGIAIHLDPIVYLPLDDSESW
jgi:hypothetical protein